MLLTLDLVGGLRFVGRCIARDASRRVDLGPPMCIVGPDLNRKNVVCPLFCTAA